MNHDTSESRTGCSTQRLCELARLVSRALVDSAENAQTLLLRMFADPYLLEKDEKPSLVAQLRECVEQISRSF